MTTLAADFASNGYRRFALFAAPILTELIDALEGHDRGHPGQRLSGMPFLAQLLARDGSLSSLLDEIISREAKPVRAVLFDKSPASNWALGWHQDRTICVNERHDVAGYGPFTLKSGLVHVEPPFDLIERMVTLRIHLDPVADDNAPLLVARGSHRFGKIPHGRIEQTIAGCDTIACLAQPGDVWAYATPIVHASKRSRSLSRRRVLQVDYSCDNLPGRLKWCGI